MLQWKGGIATNNREIKANNKVLNIHEISVGMSKFLDNLDKMYKYTEKVYSLQLT
jgi:hypothetical protein